MSGLRRAMMRASRHSGGELPTGYTAYDWVQADSTTGAPVIDAGLVPNNSLLWRFEGKFARTDDLPNNYTATWIFSRIYGTSYISNYSLGRRGRKSNILSFNYNARANSEGFSGQSSTTINIGVWHTFVLCSTDNVDYGGTLVLDGITATYTSTRPKNDTTTTLKILLPNSTTNTPYPCRFAEFKVYYDGELVADFVPVKRDADNVVGFYDVVRQSFHAPSVEGVQLLCGNGLENF